MKNAFAGCDETEDKNKNFLGCSGEPKCRTGNDEWGIVDDDDDDLKDPTPCLYARIEDQLAACEQK